MTTTLNSTDFIPNGFGRILAEINVETCVVYGLRFKADVIKFIGVALLLIAFVSLGIWQLNRAQEKQVLRDQFLARAESPPVEVQGELLDADSMVFRNAVATGRYLADYQVFLDNKVYRGQAGYHVLTPLLLSDAKALLLVNRGWMPWGRNRQLIPAVDVPSHEINVSGRLVKPARHAISFESDDKVRGFQKVWQNLDLDKYERLTGYPVHRFMMLLDSSASDGGRLIRDWPQYQDSWIQRHRGYAVQWFGLAVVVVLLFLFSLRRKS